MSHATRELLLPCPWCGREGYDRVYMDARGVSRHDACGKDVRYRSFGPQRWTIDRWLRRLGFRR